MKLQVTNAGAWKDVVEFVPGVERQVRQAAAAIAAVALRPSTTFRITTVRKSAPRSPKVVAVCEGPNYQWRNR